MDKYHIKKKKKKEKRKVLCIDFVIPNPGHDHHGRRLVATRHVFVQVLVLYYRYDNFPILSALASLNLPGR